MENEKVKVLIIEDSPEDYFLIQEMLDEVEANQFELEHAETLQEGLELFDKKICDVLLLDLGLPDSEGFETFTQTYEHSPQSPIIILTGLKDENLGTRAVKSGAQDYLVKGEISGPLLARSVNYAIERKKAEKVIEEHLQFSTTLIDTIPIPIFYKDKKGKYRGCNAAFESMVGFRKEEIIGKSVYDLYPEELAEKYHQKDEELIKNPEIQKYEYNFLFSNGEEHNVIFHKATYQNSYGEISGIIGAVTDVTELLKAEKELKKSLKEKEVLLREIHHRVKNNMQIISSLFNLESSYTTCAEEKKIFEDSQNRVKSMAMIHEKLYQSQDLAKIDFADYIKSLASVLFASYGVGPNIKLIIDVGNILFDVETAIPCGLIVNELLTNSIKHAFPQAKNGKINIELHLNDDGDFVLIVKDNGIGLPKDINFKNTDTLGLQLVNTLVGQLEGNIELIRKAGTEFIITFKELHYKERI